MSLINSYNRLHSPIQNNISPQQENISGLTGQERSEEQNGNMNLEPSYHRIKEQPIDVNETETIPQQLTRETLGTVAKIGEFPLSIMDEIKKIAGPKLSDEDLEKLKQNLSKAGFSETGVNLPTKPYKERIKEATGEYLEPKTPGEKDWYDFVENAVPYAVLGTNPELKALGKISRAAAISGAGKAAEMYTRYSGGSEGAQNFARHGTEFVASLINPGMAAKHASKLYKESEALLPLGEGANTDDIKKRLLNLKSSLERGTGAASENAVKEDVDILLDKINRGKLDYRSAMASQRSINEKSSAFLYGTPDKVAKARARHIWGKVQNELETYINTGKKKFPEAIEKWEKGKEVFGAVAGSGKALKFVAKTVKDHPLEAGVAAMLGLRFSESAGKAILNAGKAAVGIGTLKLGTIANRAIRSPEIRNLYFRALRQSLGENAPGLLKTLGQLKEKIDSNPSLSKYLKEEKIRGEYAGSKA